MAKDNVKQSDTLELTVEDKLKNLYKLQVVYSNIDKIKTLRGELPLEVQDLEDEIAGLETRIGKYEDEIKDLESSIAKKKNDIGESNNLIKKYVEQQKNVRNNREFDSLNKEIEFQTLEIELSEKRIREFTEAVNEKTAKIEEAKKILEERSEDLNNKNNELSEIISETEKEENTVSKDVKTIEDTIDERLLTAFKRIRKNARNGLAVVTVERDACGGCFNQIPPQRQLDIRSRKKIIVCEYCGRILVDGEIGE